MHDAACHTRGYHLPRSSRLQGQRLEFLFLVVEGSVAPIGKQGQPIIHHRRGAFFGTTALLDTAGKERFDTRAVTDTKLLCLPKAKLDVLFPDGPPRRRPLPPGTDFPLC